MADLGGTHLGDEGVSHVTSVGLMLTVDNPGQPWLTCGDERVDALGTGTPAVRLHALGHTLGPVGEDSKYAGCRTVGSSIYVSGQLPYENGELLGQGSLGRDAGLPRNGPIEIQMVCTEARSVGADGAPRLARRPAESGALPIQLDRM